MLHEKIRFIVYLHTKNKKEFSKNLERQREKALIYVNNVKGDMLGEIIEIGSIKSRPRLAIAFKLCRAHNAVLLLGEFGGLRFNQEFISKLIDSGIYFVSSDMPDFDNLSAAKFMKIAEERRNKIRRSIDMAKKKGVTIGGLRKGGSDITKFHSKGIIASAAVRRQKAINRALKLSSTIEDLRQAGAITLQDFADGLNNRGIPAARGGQWLRNQVRILLLDIEKALKPD